MRKGDVLFFRNSSFISRGIRFMTKSEFSHVALYIGNGEILESDIFKKTHARKLTEDDEYVVFSPKNVSEEQREGIVKYAMSRIGTGYDYKKVVWLFFRALFKLKGNPMFDDSNAYICSEIIDKAYVVNRVQRVHGYAIGDVYPVELLYLYRWES